MTSVLRWEEVIAFSKEFEGNIEASVVRKLMHFSMFCCHFTCRVEQNYNSSSIKTPIVVPNSEM